MKPKNTKVSSQTDQQTKNNIRHSQQVTSTKIASAKENNKNQNKFNINQLNSKTCDKTCVNENYDNEEREPMCILL